MYQRLVGPAKERGIGDVELLLEGLLPTAASSPFETRDALVERIHRQRERLLAERGIMADSVELLREDRER